MTEKVSTERETMNKVTISIGSVEVNGKRVGSMSGFEYEGDVEGLAAAVKAKLGSEPAKPAGKVAKLSKAQHDALASAHRWHEDGFYVRAATKRNLMERGLVKRHAHWPASFATYSPTDTGQAALAAWVP